MEFKVGFATDIGLRRQKNQDSGGAFPQLGFFVVADGMGGHRGGEIASSMVVEVLPHAIEEKRSEENFEPRRALTDGIQKANREVYERSVKEPELHGMGTTTTAMLFDKKGDRQTLYIGHVGDSRAYLVRPKGIWQLTRDHSFVAEKLRAGLITREQAKNDQTKNVITRSVGFAAETQVEIYEMDARSGDIFLICSDGLTGLVEDPEILTVIQKRAYGEGDLKAAVDDLISWSNARGGHDNITVLIAQVV